MNKLLSCLPVIILSLLLSFIPVSAEQNNTPSLSISGLVKRPAVFSLDDLNRFHQSTVRLNEVLTNHSFTGSFFYTGASLKSLLEFTGIARHKKRHVKNIDLAILIQSKDGKQAVLSWGEVFNRQYGDIIIATRSTPAMPMMSCTRCHNDGRHTARLAAMKRTVTMPRLVLPNDFFADRCLEGITGIRIIEFPVTGKRVRKKLSESQKIRIIHNKKTSMFTTLDGFHRNVLYVRQIGDGRGYHGLKQFSGVPLAEILQRKKISPDLNSVVMVSSTDGYRSLFSAGELALTPAGRNIILADRQNSTPITKGGKFNLVTQNELSAERWVRAISEIRVIPVREKAKLYIIGTGCGDTSLLTLDAISYMARSDYFICPDDIKKRFGDYMGGKPVLFNPLMCMAHFYRKTHPGTSLEESRKKVNTLRTVNILKIKKLLSEGKNVAFLDYGDPTIYGSWTYWLKEHFRDDEIEVRPGISAFNAANAMIGKNLAANGSLIITVPQGLRTNEAMLKAIASHGDTMAIFVGIKELPSLVPLLEKYYRGTTPVNIVFRAGYSQYQQLVRTDLKNAVKAARRSREKFLGLIYIGERLGTNVRPPRQSDKDPL